MITIITDMTDGKLFENYWMPLICRYRNIDFIFTRTKGLKYPKKFNWSNVKFSPNGHRGRVIPYAKTDVVYLTYQNEIPTYQIMTELIKGKAGVGTTNGKSFSMNKNLQNIKEIKEKYKTYIV